LGENNFKNVIGYLANIAYCKLILARIGLGYMIKVWIENCAVDAAALSYLRRILDFGTEKVG